MGRRTDRQPVKQLVTTNNKRQKEIAPTRCSNGSAAVSLSRCFCLSSLGPLSLALSTVRSLVHNLLLPAVSSSLRHPARASLLQLQAGQETRRANFCCAPSLKQSTLKQVKTLKKTPASNNYCIAPGLKHSARLQSAQRERSPRGTGRFYLQPLHIYLYCGTSGFLTYYPHGVSSLKKLTQGQGENSILEPKACLVLPKRNHLALRQLNRRKALRAAVVDHPDYQDHGDLTCSGGLPAHSKALSSLKSSSLPS
ncbi:hypothetical protein BDZ88DRAFT_300549 [Geranomyces variabilis]|nr:hypothetical protein BDZ88DRAFT_300549 [Geranomyces variabilis]